MSSRLGELLQPSHILYLSLISTLMLFSHSTGFLLDALRCLIGCLVPVPCFFVDRGWESLSIGVTDNSSVIGLTCNGGS